MRERVAPALPHGKGIADGVDGQYIMALNSDDEFD